MKKRSIRLKRRARRTCAALLMVTALIVAAIPPEYIQAEEDSQPEVFSEDEVLTGTDAYETAEGVVYYFNSGILTGYDYVVSPGNGLSSKEDIDTLNIPDYYYLAGDTGKDDPIAVTGIGARACIDCVGLQTVTVPTLCEAIGSQAFSGCTNLSRVTTADSLKYIKEEAFLNCSNLSSFTMPEYLTEIGDYAFQNCGLSTIDIPNSYINALGISAFSGCTKLRSAVIGDSVTKISKETFKNCSALQTVKMPTNLDTLDYGAFQNCSALRSITIPATLSTIGTNMFDGCTSLKEVIFASTSSLQAIPSYTFNNCTSLATIEMPASITTIAADAFLNCTGLNYVTLPSGLAEVANGTFGTCKNLICFTVPGKSTKLGSVNQFMNMNNGTFRIKGEIPSVAYDYAIKFNICFQSMQDDYEEDYFRVNKSGALTYANVAMITKTNTCVYIPETIGDISVKSITASTDVFKGNGSIVGVVIPATITSIAGDAFNGCQNLSRATFESENTQIGVNAFKETSDDFIMYGTITRTSKPFLYAMDNNHPFVNEDSQLKVEHDTATDRNVLTDFPDAAETLVIATGIDAFGYKTDGGVNTSIFDGSDNLKTVTIGDAVALKDHEFKNCTKLSDVFIPASVISMGVAPFSGCTSLADVDIISSNKNYTCENGIIYGLAGSAKTSIVEMLGGGTVNSSFTIPSSITEIKKEAFANLTNLNQVTFSSGVSIIPEDCFKNSSVVIANLSSAVTRIDAGAFANTKISEIHIPKETTYISDTATSGISPSALTVYGVAGTTAETFAKKFGYTFIAENSNTGSTSTSNSTSSTSTSTSSKTTSSSKKTTSTSSKTTSSSAKTSSSSTSSSSSSSKSTSSSSTSSSSSSSKSSSTTAAAATGASTTGNNTTGSNANKGNTVNVDATGAGLGDTGVISGSSDTPTDNYVVKISHTEESKKAFEEALTAKYGNLDKLRYYPMDISLYDSTGSTKIENVAGTSITLTIPIPEELALYGGNNKVATVANGQIEELAPKFSSIDGVPCVTFTATHFSPYGLYVDVSNLQAEGVLDSTPKTGDPIHPKWFLVIGLAALSILLFLKRDKREKASMA